MKQIQHLEFKEENLKAIKEYRFGSNWPVVYILNNEKEAYIGETTSAYKRSGQHLKNSNRKRLKAIHIISDDEYNKSATLHTESLLIKYFAGDGKYTLQNGNTGLSDSDYYDRERYQAKFEELWKDLKELDLVNNDLIKIENSDLFKYSPYKALTTDQVQVVNTLIDEIKNSPHSSHIVSGEPGTGKTIVATYLVKALSYKKWASDLKIGFVVPMTSLRGTLRKVFKSVKGLSAYMILGPNDVAKSYHDVLIVDEAHRLKQRKNLTNYVPFDQINKQLGLGNEGTQLDWIMKCSKHQIFFYDPKQSVQPSDIRPENFSKYSFTQHKLTSQMRVKGGDDYIKYIDNILNETATQRITLQNYDVKIFDNIAQLKKSLLSKEKEKGLSRFLAGYAWEWQTQRNNTIDYDIEIDGLKLKWNSTNSDWANSPNAVNEVGCIHTIQGYDLNYAGVIIGPEIYFDTVKNCIAVDKNKYLDFNGRRSITDPKELDEYIKNIYKTLLTRAIEGTYIYIVDPALRQYFKRYFDTYIGK